MPGSLVHEFPSNMMVSVMDECLSVLVYDKRAYSKQCTVWVMKEYGVAESWSKQYEIDLDGRLVLVLGLRKNGEMLLVMGKELVSYNPESEGIKKLGVSGCKDSFWFGDYTESLVLLGGADSVNGEAEPSVSEEAVGLEDDAVGLRAYYMQTIMLNAPEAYGVVCIVLENGAAGTSWCTMVFVCSVYSCKDVKMILCTNALGSIICYSVNQKSFQAMGMAECSSESRIIWKGLCFLDSLTMGMLTNRVKAYFSE
ncbi:hypothetical protein RHGRI_017407 [Rhododendron griersonianum]|uniref:F-box associated domain-containing protein n=1 Tax=Rhododendron griersonianum TaxID=479676 RepID=A0AAV6JXR4_9ERIC|nr:hypothetical protein RHGRI_017407 [Rhododendron griersonianum]